MSTGKRVPQSVQPRLAKAKFNINTVGETRPSVVENIDVASLQIDESFDADCDPYNSTGQFLRDERE